MRHISLPVLADVGLEVGEREMIEVDPIGANQYRLLHSPAFVDGLATGDVIELDQSLTSGFRVISRARNIVVIVAFETEQDKSLTPVEDLQRKVRDLGGVVDGGPTRVLVLTLPLRAGFERIEPLLADFIQRVPGSTWWYGNVYEAGDPSRPLDWWKQDL